MVVEVTPEMLAAGAAARPFVMMKAFGMVLRGKHGETLSANEMAKEIYLAMEGVRRESSAS